MKMPELDPQSLERLKAYSWPIFLIVVGVTLAVFIALPNFNEYFLQRNKMAEKKQKLALLTEKAAALASLDRDRLRRQLQVAESALPSEKAVPGLLSGLERIAAESGAAVTAFQISPGIISSRENSEEKNPVPVKEIATPAIPFTISLEGNYQSLKGFLLRLKKARRLIGLDKLSFVNLQTQDNPENLRTNLSLLAYYLPLPEDPPLPEEKLESISPEELDFLAEVESFEVISVAPPLLPVGKENPFAF